MKYFSQKNLSMILSIAIVIVVVLIFAFSSFIKQAQADWYSTGGTWNYRKTITIDNVKVPNTDQTDFPVLVDITDSDLAANARSDGFDIFFTSSDGTTKLAHEREIYTTATGRLTTWVKVPTLSTSVDTLIYMYYGNASSGDMQDVAPIKTAVWDSNYKGVWHLGDGDSTAANFYQDSTTGNSDGTLTDGDGDVTQTDGQIGKAMNFNTGDVDFITTADTAEGASTITVIAGVKLTNNTDYHGLVSHTNGSSASDGWWLTQVVNQNNYNLSLSDADHTTAGFPSTVGNWHYLTVTFADAPTLGRAYHNGVPYVIFSSADQITESASTLKIGKEGSFYGDSFWLGGIDEVRISGSVRSEQWIQTEYNNQSATSTFYTVSSASSPTAGTLTVAGNFTLGGAGNVTVDANTDDPIIDIGGDFTIGASDVFLQSNTASTTIAGSFTNSGTFTHNRAITWFDANGTGKSIDDGSSSFDHVTFNNSLGCWTFSGNNTVSGNLTVTTGAVTGSTGIVTVGGNFSLNGGSFTHNSGTITFASTTPHTITGSVTFYNFTDTTASSSIRFDDNDATTFTIAAGGTWTMTGSQGAPVEIRSDSAGNQYTMDFQGSVSFTHVTVKDAGCYVSSDSIVVTNDHTFSEGNNGNCWVFINRSNPGSSEGNHGGGD